MANLRFSLILLPLFARFCLSFGSTLIDTCSTSCQVGKQPIQFPFQQTYQRNKSCGYPGFDLSCDDWGHTVINLPQAGNFIVEYINYRRQTISLKDPQGCLPRRLQTFSTSGSVFRAASYRNITFANCSAGSSLIFHGYRHVQCLGGKTDMVVIVPEDDFLGLPRWAPHLCQEYWTVAVPIVHDDYPWSIETLGSIELTWDLPACGSCEEHLGRCRMKNQKTLETTCDVPLEDASRHRDWAMIVGVMTPSAIFVTGVCYCILKRRQALAANIRRSTREPVLDTTAPAGGQGQQQWRTDINPMGMDSPALASYPKIKLSGNMSPLSESGYDDACTICLQDYRTNDTVKIIPECNHHFHEHCLDRWLRKKATCPLCRKQQHRQQNRTPND